MEPAATIISKLGGPRAVAEAAGVAYTAPYRWQYPIARGGTGGRIPQSHHGALLAFAKEIGVPLAPADLVAPSSEVAP